MSSEPTRGARSRPAAPALRAPVAAAAALIAGQPGGRLRRQIAAGRVIRLPPPGGCPHQRFTGSPPNGRWLPTWPGHRSAGRLGAHVPHRKSRDSPSARSRRAPASPSRPSCCSRWLTAVTLALAPSRPGLRALLSAGAALMGLGSLISAAAPSFAVLAGGQAVLGVGIGMLVAIATAAAGTWSQPADRSRTLAWAIAGMPVAWVVGMPLTGVADAADWRLAWIAVPFAASLLTRLALDRRLQPRHGLLAG